jgi:DNA uptake protein ComE-like DNA-binding protein
MLQRQPTETAPWTPSQRGVLLALIVILCVALAARLYFNRSYISDPQPTRPARFDDLADRLDPNIAGWQSLAVLPQLGEKRARDIIDYRERFARQHPNQPAFKRPQDLLYVKGIGVAMLETLRPYLQFPATTQPTTHP